MKNFAFEHEGQTYWYSRSMTTVGYVFAYSDEAEGWCVLANKRGPGCPTCVGKWNVPCGYLEHDIAARDNCIKEIKEETGLMVSPNELRFLWIHSKPDTKKQNVDLSFYVMMHKNVEDLQTTDMFSEPGEVAEIKWIPIKELDKYTFAFNQKRRIKEIYKKYVDIGFFKWLMIKFTDMLMKKYIFEPVK